MAEFYASLDETLRAFIAEQKVFFVATAPAEGRISLSPKGMDTLRCLDDRTVAYLDLTGSGNETAAHLAENGRITVMVCSFSARPMILRLYGRGRTVQPEDAAWSDLYPLFDPLPGVRQIMVISVESVQTSCGYGVPVYEFVKERETLRRWAESKGEEALAAYRQANNRISIDGRRVE